MAEPNTPPGPPSGTDRNADATQNLERAARVPDNGIDGTVAANDVVSASFEEYSEGESDVADAIEDAVSKNVAKDLLGEERAQGRLNLRSRQAVLHHSLTTLRLNDLERELADLKAAIYKTDVELDVVKQLKKKTKLPAHLHEMRRSTLKESRIVYETITLPTEQQPALEVLFAESPLSILSHERNTPQQGSGYEQAPNTGIGEHDGLAGSRHSATPDRVRIRSRPLLWHLQKLSGSNIFSRMTTEEIDDKRVYGAMVFLRPFKFFIDNHVNIKESLADVEAKAKQALWENEVNEVDGENLEKWSSTSDTPQFDIQFDIQDLMKDLTLLVEFLDVYLKPTFDLRKSIQDGSAVEIEYPDLWHLFKRGELVVTRAKQDHAFMVANTAGGREPLVARTRHDGPNASLQTGGFVVDCFSMGTDGESYMPKLAKICIRRFHGSQPISSLPVYPLWLAPNRDELQSTFRKRGGEFVDITRKPFSHHTVLGKTLDEPSHEVDAQAIVDMTLALDAKPDWKLPHEIHAVDLTRRDVRELSAPLWCKHSRMEEGCCGSDIIFKDFEYDDLSTEAFIKKNGRLLGPIRGEDLEDDDLLLMRPYVHAFVLRSRQWATVRVADLHEVEFENRLSDLVLPEGHKATVRALVATHENNRSPHADASNNTKMSISGALDLVKGKGSGLVILLHGPPGVGKTSTAECVADDTKRPLYPITCGDIGETAAEVESNLQRNFRRAHKWGCVLLLDEADIFLAKRTKHDLRHNAVTSVFLRSLEYYAGILFLTTNRVGTVDPAFKSRIQMSLFYPKLSLDVTLALYEKFIKRAKMEQDRSQTHIFKIKEKEILKFAKRHFRELHKQHYDTWNGRQIRNAFQTAIALVEHETLSQAEDTPKPVLGRSHFETVADGFRKFDKYLIMTLGKKEGDAAKHEGLRDDSFEIAGDYNASALPTPPGVAHRARGRRSAVSIRQGPAQSYSVGESDSESESESDGDSDSSEDRPRR